MNTNTLRPALSAAINLPLVARLGRNRLMLSGIALALIAAGVAWQWNWLVAIGVAPLLVSVAPCVAMCALGLCMFHIGGRACANTQNEPTLSNSPPPSLEEEK